MPSASVTTTVAVKPGDFFNRRSAYFTWATMSAAAPSMRQLPEDIEEYRDYHGAAKGRGRSRVRYVTFPTPGCWEVTRLVGDAHVTFITRVVKIGEGPQG